MSFYSKVVLDGDGTVGPFIFDKGYLNKSHVKCYLNGNSVGFSFITGSTINLDVATEIGDVLVIKRETPELDPIVDFNNGALLTEQNLDESTLQVLYVTQESIDQLDGVLSSDIAGNFDALNRKITNLSPATQSGDAVAYEQVVGILDQIQGLADQVAQDATDAETSAQNAAQFDFENHDHEISDVTGLQDALDDKASVSDLNDKADLSALEGNSLPLGSVIFLCVDVAPPGFLPAKGQSFDPLVYPEFFAAYGKTTMPNIANRVIRGDGVLAGNVDDYQEDAMQRITGSIASEGHRFDNVFHDNDGAFNFIQGPSTHYITRSANNASNDRIGVEFDSGDSPNARVSDDETRVKSWIGYPIVKVSSAYVNQGTTDLAALENAINSAVRNDIPQTFADGGAQVRENIGVKDQAWEHIQTISTDTPVLDFTFQNLSQYRALKLSFDVRPDTDHAQLWLRTSRDNGSNFDAGPSDYGYVQHFAWHAGHGYGGGHSSTAFVLAANLGNASSAYRVAGELQLTELNKLKRTYMKGEYFNLNRSPDLVSYGFGGLNAHAEANDAIRIFFNAGQIAEGFVTLEGIKG